MKVQDFDLIGALEAKAGASRDDVLAERQRRVEDFSRRVEESARDYVAGPELRTAINVALSLGRPLLLTGEPGCGKTLAAAWIAGLLGVGPERTHEFQVRSDSRARDLRYDFDAVSWFRASQLATEMKAGSEVPKADFLHPRPLGLAFGWNGPTDCPHLVLIDEVDKAPRDFPNDLLLELDQMRFVVDETGMSVGPPAHRPVIVITSNSERRLPDPFLRRCVVHHIELSPETVLKILRLRLAPLGAGNEKLLQAATQFWAKLSDRGLARKPTIAEFWQWVGLEARHGGGDPTELTTAFADPLKLAQRPFIGSLLSPGDLAKMGGGA